MEIFFVVSGTFAETLAVSQKITALKGESPLFP